MEEKQPVKPKGIGSILDQSFQIYRQHFVKIFLVMLIILGPFFLVEDVLADRMGGSFVPDFQHVSSPDQYVQEFFGPQDEFETVNPGNMLLLIFIIYPLMYLGAYPLAMSSMLHLVRATYQRQDMSVSEMLKRPFARFWPMVGNSVLYGLIIFSIHFLLVIGMVIFSMIVMFSIVFSMDVFQGAPGAATADGVGEIIIVFVLMFGLGMLIFLLGSFFALRWGFYLPLVVLEDKGIGLGASWRLTKKNFWRLFGIFLLLFIIYFIISSALTALAVALLGFSIVGHLVQLLIYLFLTPILMLVYAVVYFDLQVRSQAVDLDHLLDQSSDSSTSVSKTPSATETPSTPSSDSEAKPKHNPSDRNGV